MNREGYTLQKAVDALVKDNAYWEAEAMAEFLRENPEYRSDTERIWAQREGSQVEITNWSADTLATYDIPETELVDAAFACPKCGERDMDQLPWNEDDDTVTCGRCGHTYDPSAEA